MLKVCLVSQEFPDDTDFGGISTYNHYLSKGLANKGCKVFVICRSYIESKQYNVNSIDVIRICEQEEVQYRKIVATTVAKLIEKYNIDIIESPEWGADLYEYFRLYKEKYKVPVVIKLHTPYFLWKKYNMVKEQSEIKYIEKMEKYIVCNADAVFSCSDALKKLVALEYGIYEGEIKTIPNMIDISFDSNNTIYEKNSIYYIGSLEQRKGVLVLAEAFKSVRKQISDAKLYFVGRDTTRNSRNISTQLYIREILDGSKNVYFVNHVCNSSVSSYINNANLLVFPSIFENFPYVVLESMLYGKGIIGSSNGGMNEMIIDGECGALYNPPNVKELANKIIYALSTDGIIDEWGKNAKEKVKNFSTNLIIDTQINYYKKIIGICHGR